MATMTRRHWQEHKTQVDIIEALGSNPDFEYENRGRIHINYWNNISALDKAAIATQINAMNFQFLYDEEVEI